MAGSHRVKILIVDDKPANLLALEAVLDSPLYELVRAGSGLEAVERVEKDAFAAILLDVQMPDIDGYEAARRIKRLPNGRDVPIIFVTAVYNEDEDARRGYAAGGLDYFPKPLDPELLKTKIRLYSDLFLMSRATRDQGSLAAVLRERRIAERKLETILRAISEGVVVADRDGAIVQTNAEALRVFGSESGVPFSRRGEYVGTHPETGEVIASGDWPLLRALETGEPTASELTELALPDGSRTTILNSASPVRTEDGEVVGAVCVFKELPRAASLEPPAGRARSRRRGPRDQRAAPPASSARSQGAHASRPPS